MRALKIMLFLTALVSFVSCSKEENDPELETEMLLGEWHLEEFNYSGTNVYSAGNETASVSYTGEAVEIDFETVFLKDGTYITWAPTQLSLLQLPREKLLLRSSPILILIPPGPTVSMATRSLRPMNRNTRDRR